MDERIKQIDQLYTKLKDYETGKFIEHDFAAIQLTKAECKLITDSLMTRQLVIKMIDDGK